MSKSDLVSIGHVLNKTNFRILAWYMGPVDTEKAGVRDVKLLGRMPMQSTGGERFSAYVYFKTYQYQPGVEAFWSDDEDPQPEPP
jgi:hypothetical protein